MLAFRIVNSTPDSKFAKQQGFVVLTIVILLSLAGILFTVNMAASQLVDNYIIENYYRNNEAFSNAESGISFVLSQLADPVTTQALVFSLPMTYESSEHNFQVAVTKIIDNRLAVSAIGRSVDSSAQREINLEVDFSLIFPIPKAAISANGKINLDESALVNDGCEGLEKHDCFSSGSVAENMMLSNPAIEIDEEVCSGGRVGENTIADNVLKGSSTEKIISKISDSNGVQRYDWGEGAIPNDIDIFGVTTGGVTTANSLFEATFTVALNQDNLDTIWDNAVQIDTSTGGDCSEQLQMIDDEKRIIYIKGNCHISQYYAEQSNTSENKVFTVGSTENPKLIFIEGGTFITSANTGAAIIGMLYFLPAKNELIDKHGNLVDNNGDQLSDNLAAVVVEDASVDMGGVNVNGAVLSEYKCSHDGQDKRDNKGTKQHFSARFDKLILDKLYSDLGVPPIGSRYRVTTGSWRDF